MKKTVGTSDDDDHELLLVEVPPGGEVQVYAGEVVVGAHPRFEEDDTGVVEPKPGAVVAWLCLGEVEDGLGEGRWLCLRDPHYPTGTVLRELPTVLELSVLGRGQGT